MLSSFYLTHYDVMCEIGFQIDKKSPPHVTSEHHYDPAKDLWSIAVKINGIKGSFSYPVEDLSLSIDEFSKKHVVPFVSRVYGKEAVPV